mmetsp:Transcript_105/g.250  ORF Transcript_105/g.250 Transcript_105/m.250 type:complete len:358 (+) Transcript_105:335-1408(+)
MAAPRRNARSHYWLLCYHGQNCILFSFLLWLAQHSPRASGFAPKSSFFSKDFFKSSSESLAASPALYAFKLPSLFPWDAPSITGKTVGERNGLDLEYPWRFEGRFIFRPSLVRAGRDGNFEPPSANLVSLFGYSLGGSVVLEYDVSPVGPYREYVTMGGVVVGGLVSVQEPYKQGGVGNDGKNKLLGVGQWGNNLYVSTQVAEDVCKQVWGVPAQVAEIEFLEEGDVLSDYFLQSDKSFTLSGWKNSRILSSPKEANADERGRSVKRYGNIPIFWTPTIKALWAPFAIPTNNRAENDSPLPVHKLRLSASALRVRRCDRIMSRAKTSSTGEIPLGLALVVDNVLIEIGEKVTSGCLR